MKNKFTSWNDPCVEPKKPKKPKFIFDKTEVLSTHRHWLDQYVGELTVFGQPGKWFYNYTDRLPWHKCLEHAKTLVNSNCALLYEEALSYFHNGSKIDIKHIISGINMSNGFPYLCLGYEILENKND